MLPVVPPLQTLPEVTVHATCVCCAIDVSCTCVQDAREYFQYLLDVMSRAERTSMQRLGQPDQPATADAFKFELEDRIQCLESGRLSYKRSLTNVLAMDIPVDAATNKDELEDFQVCKERVSSATVLQVCYSQSQDRFCSTVRYHIQHMQVPQPDQKSCCNQTACNSLVPAARQQTTCWKHREICAGAGGKAC